MSRIMELLVTFFRLEPYTLMIANRGTGDGLTDDTGLLLLPLSEMNCIKY